MTALNTDLVRKAAPLFATQLSAPILSSDTTIPLNSVAGLPLDTAVTITIDATDANGNLTPTFKETVTGVVNAGTVSLTNCLRGLDGTTAQAHSTGANVVQWFTANDWNDFMASYLTEHVQLGHHQTLNDVNGKIWISQTATSNAVNTLDVANSASGSGIVLSAVGTDANIPVTLTPKGSSPIILPATLDIAGPITAVGGASNIDIPITPKGTGVVSIPSGKLSTVALFNPYKFSVHLATNQTGIVDATTVKVLFDTKDFDTGSNFDAVTNHRFTAPIAGFYQINSYVNILSPGNTGVSSIIYLFKNGVNIQQGDGLYPNIGVGNQVIAFGNISHLVQLAAGDYLEIFVFMDVTSNTVTVNGGAGLTSFSGFLVSPT